MKTLWSACLLGLVSLGIACAESGMAEAELLLESTTYQPGKPLHAAIRITYVKGWHGYWINPGEGGMKTGFSWSLPQGWTVGDPGYPAPVRQVAGGLVNYGYSGEVLHPVVLQPPARADGHAVLEVKVNWLACNPDGCVPGDAVLHAAVTKGALREGPDAARVRKAREVLPAAHPGLSLGVTESDNSVELEISGESLPDLAGAEVFPVTERALSPATPILLTKVGGKYRASVGKNEYAEGPLKHLSLVIRHKSLPRPIAVEWRSPSFPLDK